ncbi:MAG TPA: aspartate dehydrogenase [candidate division Zixibacteria bacterium]|nr:aspartate dehydrogenase [candidate division Zixibacteria bacterium]
MSSKAIGIVGCGAIGKALLKASAAGLLPVRVAGVTSRTEESARAFLSSLDSPPPFLPLAELIVAADLIIEAAGGAVVAGLADAAFTAHKDLMVISVGALLEHPEIIERARATGCRLHVPSGAIAGLDGIKSACAGRVDHVTMTTRKPPRGLEGAPYLVRNGITLAGLEEEKEVFSGSAREACQGFPANVNVCAAVSLAGVGPDRTRVRILAVPGLERNCHDIEVEGEFGRLHVHIENVPSENPRTGKLTALSIVRAVQQVVDPVRIGN